jgi:hypothetical protein
MRPKALLGEERASRRHDCNRHDEIVEADVCFGDMAIVSGRRPSFRDCRF